MKDAGKGSCLTQASRARVLYRIRLWDKSSGRANSTEIENENSGSRFKIQG